MNKEFQRKKFTELRLEYYVSGRTLWFSDTMTMGALLLGYAIEMHLKHAIAENEIHTPKKLLYKHDIPALYEHCQENGLFKDVHATKDLLYYVSDMLHQRYPAQSIETSVEAEKRGHAISLSIGVISAYDDLVIQLDDSLRQQLSNPDVSIGLKASHFINRHQGRAFFHSNIAALKNIEFYRKHISDEYENAEERMQKEGLTPTTIQYNLSNQRQRLDTLSDAPESIWQYNKFSTLIPPDFDSQIKMSPTKNFKYPGRIIKY